MPRPGSGPLLALPKPVDVETALGEVLARLPELDGVLVGGVAMAVYGIVCFTRDVDLAVSEAIVAEAARILADADPRPLRIGGISLATKTGARVDLIDRRHGLRGLYQETIEAARAEGPCVRIGERILRVAPLPYLVAMKMGADRPQDEADLDRLIGLQALHYPPCRKVVERHLGFYAGQRLDKLARAVGRLDAPADFTMGGKYAD